MIISKNTHSPVRVPCVMLDNDFLRYMVEFTDSCVYDIGQDQSDVNKLFGFGYFPHHHTNSVRFGWRWMDGRMEIVAGWYLNRERYMAPICSVHLNKKYMFVIQKFNDKHILLVWDEITKRLVGPEFAVPVRGRRLSYLLGPYFGGNRKAPHDMEIKIKRA